MIEEIENYINGEDYPDEIPKRIMGLFERKHADLLAEVKRLREVIEQHGIDISFDPKHNEEDEAILYEWLDATSQGYWGSVYEYKVMKQEESE